MFKFLKRLTEPDPKPARHFCATQTPWVPSACDGPYFRALDCPRHQLSFNAGFIHQARRSVAEVPPIDSPVCHR